MIALRQNPAYRSTQELRQRAKAKTFARCFNKVRQNGVRERNIVDIVANIFKRLIKEAS